MCISHTVFQAMHCVLVKRFSSTLRKFSNNVCYMQLLNIQIYTKKQVLCTSHYTEIVHCEYC